MKLKLKKILKNLVTKEKHNIGWSILVTCSIWSHTLYFFTTPFIQVMFLFIGLAYTLNLVSFILIFVDNLYAHHPQHLTLHQPTPTPPPIPCIVIMCAFYFYMKYFSFVARFKVHKDPGFQS